MQQHTNISSTFSEYCIGYCGFGFNGQEKDQEIYNNQSTTTAMFWEYDGRIGRRWNLDPKPQISISDYVVMGNNPILCNDVLGDVLDVSNDKNTKDDINKLAKGKNQDYIKYDENGRVSLDFGKKSPEKIKKLLTDDEGLALINDIVNAKDKDGKDLKFFYSTDGKGAVNKLTGEITTGFGLSNGFELTNGEVGGSTFFLNASNTNYGFYNGENVNYDYAPKKGYDGQVSVAPGEVNVYEQRQYNKVIDRGGGYYEQIRGTENILVPCRTDLIKHELRENLIRANGMNYEEAHKKASEIYKGKGAEWSKFKAN